MAFNVNKILSNISNSAFAKTASQNASKAMTSLGRGISSICDKKDSFQKGLSAIEPTGGDNSWFLMLGLMLAVVLGPRTKTAMKRNPDNKEATRDEITEILFRDIQTIGIILLALKALNTIISAIGGKATGIPMSNKPYQQLFNSTGLKNRAQEFVKAPMEKLRIAAKNVWDTINPIGGKMSYTKEQSIEKYSGQNSILQIKKMFENIEHQKGKPEKVFQLVLDSLIEKQNKAISLIESNAKASASALGIYDEKSSNSLTNAKERLQDLLNLKESGYQSFKDGSTALNNATENMLISFFKDKENPLAQKVINLNGWLKTLAYGIEIGYLGFGLPFLNQKRLEKKYLKDSPKESIPQTMPEIRNASLTNIKLKEQEIKLYHNFIKK